MLEEVLAVYRSAAPATPAKGWDELREECDKLEADEAALPTPEPRVTDDEFVPETGINPAAPPDEAKALEGGPPAHLSAWERIAWWQGFNASCREHHRAALSAPPRTGPSEEAVRAGRYAYDTEALRDGTQVTQFSWIYPILRAAYAVDFGAGAPERALSPQEIERAVQATLDAIIYDPKIQDSRESIVAAVRASLTPRTEDAKQ